jgi:hypothetical protein
MVVKGAVVELVLHLLSLVRQSLTLAGAADPLHIVVVQKQLIKLQVVLEVVATVADLHLEL